MSVQAQKNMFSYKFLDTADIDNFRITDQFIFGAPDL